MKRILLSGCSILLCLVFFNIAAFAGEIVIIGNKDIPESSVDKSWVKNAYLGNITKWKNNEPIILTIMKDESLHQDFLKAYIKRHPSQFTAFWKNIVFTGRGKMPRKMSSNEEMLNYVANTRGAIGYLSSGAASDKVKVISNK